jgi:NTP pyrophosphatase (non-canonical NTP hydrolase)
MTEMKPVSRILPPGECRDVAEFHEKFGMLVFARPGHLTRRKLRERLACLREELDELEEAVEKQDLAAQADALVDLVYFAKGTAVMLGLPWESCWNAVHQANMAKERGVGKRGQLVDCVKPAGWQPPDLLRLLSIWSYRPELAAREEGHRDDPEHIK